MDQRFAQLVSRSFYLLPVLLLFGSFTADSETVVRMCMVALGLGWLFLQGSIFAARVPWLDIRIDSLVAGCAYVFACSQIHELYKTQWVILFCLQGLLLVSSIGVLAIIRPTLVSFGRFEMLVWLGSTLFLFNKVYLYWRFGIETFFVAWVGAKAIIAIDWVVVIFLISRLGQMKGAEHRVRECTMVAMLCFAIFGIVGLGRYAMIYHYSQQVQEAFVDGDRGQARRAAASLQALDLDLNRNNASLMAVLTDLRGARKNGALDLQLAHELGRFALEHRMWFMALDIYHEILDEYPHNYEAKVRWAGAQFEAGLRKEGFDAHLEIAASDDGKAENWLALGVAQMKMGLWVEAGRSFDLAMRRAGLQETLLAARGADDLLQIDLTELLPENFELYKSRVSAFECAYYLRAKGWSVFHPAMGIGATGVLTPVAITALSGGGSSWTEETIDVGATLASLRKRGYNIAIIDPESGAVQAKANFDTWEDKREGFRLGNFIRAVPRVILSWVPLMMPVVGGLPIGLGRR